MKRSFPANIDGQVFYIDEDAYNLLNDYLQQLSNTFRGEEGAEIVSDIESRIRELFVERGASIIVLSDVQNVIATMGRPEEINGSSDSTAEVPPIPSEANTAPSHPWSKFGFQPRHRLFRNMQNKVFGGVLGGMAAYLGWNANIMRILYVVLTLCIPSVTFWPLIIIYLVGWMVIPAAVTPRQVLEMKGEPVNVDTIGQTMIAPPEYHEDSAGIVTNALRIAGKVVMAFVGFVSGLGIFGCTIAFLVISVGMIAFSAFGSTGILDGLNFYEPDDLLYMWANLWLWLDGLLLAITICVALVWTAACILFKAKAASRTTIIAWMITLIILLVICFVLNALI